MPRLRRRRPRYEARGDSGPRAGDGRAYDRPPLQARAKAGIHNRHPHPRRPRLRGAGPQVQNNSEARHARGSFLRRHRHPGQDGDWLALGDLSLKFLHTPGHAKDLVSILLPGRILTADALLIGSCGRTDLLNSHAVRQYHTLYYTYKSLPDELEVWPGHDYKGRSSSTLGDEKRDNPKMLFGSEEEFVRFMDLENPKRLDPVEHLAEALKANMKQRSNRWQRLSCSA